MVRSSDEGKTWTQAGGLLRRRRRQPRPAHRPARRRHARRARSSPGDHKRRRALQEPTRTSPANAFRDNARASAARRWSPAATAARRGTRRRATSSPTGSVSAPVRQLEDGTCILGLYGEKHAGREALASAAACRSTDRGKTWEPPVADRKPARRFARRRDRHHPAEGRPAVRGAAAQQGEHAFRDQHRRGQNRGRRRKDIGFKGHCPHLTRLSTGEILLVDARPADRAAHQPRRRARPGRDRSRSITSSARIPRRSS